MKAHVMSEFQAVRSTGDDLEIIQFVLDQEWLDRMRENVTPEH